MPNFVFEVIADQNILVDRGKFWIQKQRQGHSLHYVVPYQACFAPQIPEFFIKNFSKEEDIVLDPFTGSSTTGVAAIRHGRRFIGIDTNTEYLQLSIKRIEEEIANISSDPKLVREVA